MGVDTIYPVGTILTRREKQGDDNDVLRVVGSGERVIVTSHEAFTGNFEIKVADARTHYEASYPEGVEVSRIPPVGDKGKSPEQIFAEAAAKPGATTKRIRKGTKVDDKSVVEGGS